MRNNGKKMLAVMLLGVVAVGSYFISGTYAKYTSTVSGSDDAVVAKWSFKIGDKDFTSNANVTGGHTFNLFETIKDTDGTTAETDTSGKLAPGTSGSFAIVLQNTSEVTAKYAIDFTEKKGSAVTNAKIQYSLDGTNWKNTIDELDIAAAEDGANSTKLAIGSTAVTKTVYWKWAYEVTGEGEPTAQDETDTAVGFAANTATATDKTITVTANVTFTQVD